MSNYEKVAELCRKHGMHFSVSEGSGYVIFRLLKPGGIPIDVKVDKSAYISDIELDVKAYRKIYKVLNSESF